MQEVAKHHRIIDFRNAFGKDEKWLAIDCAFIESGIRYAKNNGCKRILFGSLNDTSTANKVRIDILGRLADLEGVIWQIPIPKQADLSALFAHRGLKYLSIVKPNLAIDLAFFPKLELLDFSFSERISGYEMAKNLRYIKVSKLPANLSFLGAVKNLVTLDVTRSNIESLSGIENIANLENLSLRLCTKLTDISHAAGLKKLKSLHMDGTSKLTDISILGEFESLVSLWLHSKRIDSCGFIAAMKSLEFANLNTEVGDNDLSPVLKSKTLKEIRFSPMKRTYFPKLSLDEINNMLAARKR